MNKNLLLSDQARAISIPKMEVEANDVSCKHGSVTSRINPEQLFYLQSRGMDAVQSKELLIQAFLGLNTLGFDTAVRSSVIKAGEEIMDKYSEALKKLASN